MHAHGICHGQLAPSNLLLDTQWRVKIADFGSSKFTHDERPPVGGNGVANYLPPARFETGKGRSATNDVYAFGLILYEIITGRPVYATRMRPLVVLRHILLGTRATIPESIRPEIGRLIDQCRSADKLEGRSFAEIVCRLKDVKFKIMCQVRRGMVAKFFSDIEQWEARNRESDDGGSRIE
jgi:serine/threonine protein kinase